MNKYRLKKEAVQFFNKNIATTVCDIETWKKYQVDKLALEEVEEMYLTFGHDKGGHDSLSGWGNGDGSHFHFTVNFPSVQYFESDKFMNGKISRRLMDKIQCEINGFYEEFLNEQKDESIKK